MKTRKVGKCEKCSSNSVSAIFDLVALVRFNERGLDTGERVLNWQCRNRGYRIPFRKRESKKRQQ